LVKRTLRGAIRLDHVLARSSDRPVASLDTGVRAALRLGAAQLLLFDRIPKHAAVAETVAAVAEIAPRGAGLVNAVLRRVASSEERPGRVSLPADADAASRLALETSHPAWLVRRWLSDLGEAAARAALEADEADAPMDLLADPRLGEVETIREELHAAGVETRRSPWAPLALTVLGGDAAAHPLVRSGALAVVDAAAQATVEALPPSDLVLDLAAAPGGKTRTLLARGLARRVIALERTATRASRLAANLEASGRRVEVLVVQADSTRPPLPPARFDSVLLDAPCSGTGTLRKNPEIRLRLREEDLSGFAARQRALFATALPLLSPGGTLAYVTCSLEPEENEAVADAVLREAPGFLRVRPDPDRLPPPLAACLRPTGLIRVPPGETNDGFSLLVVRRAPV
ncbi:MAG: RsmB/NOP family class I SAM-dependent RNA methyltransferase, partial [Thermoanaerobaculia bacterium]